MGKYEELKVFPEKQFRILTGIQRDSFEKMVSVLLQAQQRRYRKNGRKGNLSIEDKLLMALEYLRQYRTYFYLGSSYGLSQSACYRAYRCVEDVLIKSGAFSLPGKKELFKSDMEYEVILIDAKKSPIESPKKKSERKKE